MILSDRILKFSLGERYYLLVNPVNGAIDIAPKDLLSSNLESSIDSLSQRGYLMSDEELQKSISLLEVVYREHAKNIPYWFYILTTLNCNFQCPICYERNVLQKSQITHEVIDDAIKSIENLQKLHNIDDSRIEIVLFGGDPLCISDKSLIVQLLENCEQRDWRVVIVTNGSRVENFIDIFKKYRETISDFRITLDGTESVHNARRPYISGRGSFNDVVDSIDLLLDSQLQVKMQTILGAGNLANLDDITEFLTKKKWLSHPLFQWRIEGSHDYANLDPEKDEITEGQMVCNLIRVWDKYEVLRGNMKFESFKYLGHIVHSFGWLGEYKTYWGPKFGFCEPQKGFHYVYNTAGQIYHCPRTINMKDFEVGQNELKGRTILNRKECLDCKVNTLCGGGCALQRIFHRNFLCKDYVISILTEFVNLMSERILTRAHPDKIISVNKLWI